MNLQEKLDFINNHTIDCSRETLIKWFKSEMMEILGRRIEKFNETISGVETNKQTTHAAIKKNVESILTDNGYHTSNPDRAPNPGEVFYVVDLHVRILSNDPERLSLNHFQNTGFIQEPKRKEMHPEWTAFLSSWYPIRSEGMILCDLITLHGLTDDLKNSMLAFLKKHN